MTKLIVDSRIRIPKSLMSETAISRRYDVVLFNEKACAKCDNASDRPNDLCEDCPALLANYQLWKDEGKFWSVPQGDLLSLTRVLDRKGIDYTIDDRRKDVPFRHDIRWTGSLYGKDYVDADGIPRANQKRVAKEWLAVKAGILQAPPRSGKTVLGIYLGVRLKQRFIIFAHQYEFLKEFERTIREMTNINELEKARRKPIIKLINSQADLKSAKKYDIILMSYQKLIYSPDRIANYLDGNFATLLVDECHNAGAINYLRIVSLLNVKYRLSLSATPKRKDGRHKLIQRIMGPVTAVAESTSLIPRVELFLSKAVPPRPYKVWHHAKRWLDLDKTRNIEIIKQTFTDLRGGHEVILIPVDSLAHQKLLVEAINGAAKRFNSTKNENWPKDLALAFNGEGGTKSEKRKATLLKVDEPGPTVLVAIRKLIREGVNLRRPSMMYIVEPMSSQDRSIGAPMFYQLSMRVCTPAKKPQPVVRIWVDNVRMFQSCLKGLFWNEIFVNRFDGTKGRYILDPKLVDVVKSIDKDGMIRTQQLTNKRGWV